MALNRNKMNKNAGLASPEIMRGIDIVPNSMESVKNIKNISRNLIAFHENNDYRELDNDEGIRQLADAIKRQGLLDNLVVAQRASRMPDQKDKKYVLLSGERRLRAINLLCKEDPSLEAQFASVTCNVFTDEQFTLPQQRMDALHNNGYDDIQIRDIQEMIIIDEANLQRRGGVGDEKQQRKAAARYSENLVIIYGISQKEADELTKRISGQSQRSTENNLKLERDLVEPLRNLLDKDVLSKKVATKFCALPVERQEKISEALTALDQGQMQEDGSPTAEFSEAVNAIDRTLEIRNEHEKEEALNTAIGAVQRQVQDIRKKKQGTIKHSVIRSDKHERLMSNIQVLQRRVEIMSKASMIEDFARDELLNTSEDTIVNSLDRIIERLKSLRDQISSEAEKIGRK